MLPATVVSYDDAINRAVVRPLIMVGTTDGRKISRGAIPNIPVFRFGGGGFFVRFPIKPGDFGWIKANDRDVSLMFQRGGQEDWPNTERLHSFSDAMFFPDTLKDWAIDGENSDALVIPVHDRRCLRIAA
ncbi:phage baseplate protein [Bordetella avium]|nr:phage baseplate protein [Bordetella avium]